MSRYITVDGGTTNTRISLAKNGEIIDTLKFSAGAAKGAENKKLLENTVRCGIGEMLEKHGLKSGDIEQVLVSGMLTSEYGIFELEHAKAPVGINELAKAAKTVCLKEITDIPITFMCGVKTECEDFEAADMMRGEETELAGLEDNLSGECAYVLPGSHSKVIFTDENGKIADFSTFLTGEMIFTLANDTILKSAVDLNVFEPSKEYLHRGYAYAEKFGINKALFKVRVLKNMFEGSKAEAYGFFIGAVLQGEISQLLKLEPKRITIGGKKQLKCAMYELLKNKFGGEIKCVSDKRAEAAPALGMIKIYEIKKKESQK